MYDAALPAEPEVLPEPLVMPDPTVPGGRPSGVTAELAGGVGVGELEFEIVGETVGEALCVKGGYSMSAYSLKWGRGVIDLPNFNITTGINPASR